MKIYLDFHDWWIGLYVGDDHLYFCPLPCVVIRWCRPNGHEHITELGNYQSVGAVADEMSYCRHPKDGLSCKVVGCDHGACCS